MKNVLIVQTSFIGDTIVSTPVIAAVKKKHPEAKIWFMCTKISSELVRNDKLLEDVIIFDKRSSKKGFGGLLAQARLLKSFNFDAVYSLHKSYRTAVLLFLSRIPLRIGFTKAKLSFLYNKLVVRPVNQHDVIRNLSIVSDTRNPDLTKLLSDYELELRLYLPEGYSFQDPAYKELKDSKYIAIVPGSAWKTKMWHWKNYRQVAEHFLKENRNVILLGAPQETEVCAKIADGIALKDFSGKTNLLDTMYIIKNAALLICNDSMALHMASAFKTPNVAIFCATSPTFGFSPWKNKAIVVEKQGLACKPCMRHGSNKCPTGTESCMRDLPADQVIGAAVRLLA